MEDIGVLSHTGTRTCGVQTQRVRECTYETYSDFIASTEWRLTDV